jgi:hypothetical protein
MDVASLLNPLPERFAAAESLMMLTAPAALSIDASAGPTPADAMLSPPTRVVVAAIPTQLSPLALKNSRQLQPERTPTTNAEATKHAGVCAVAGCLRSATIAANKCVVHRGMKLCAMAGCSRPVQSRGCCKSHGGGARCKHPDCSKGAISKGRCRSHGGGTRCAVPDCAKWAQRLGCCVRHSKTVSRRL